MNDDIDIINQKLSKAHYVIANKFYTGDGVKRDMQTALKFYKLSANSGNIASQNNLALMYHKGEGVTKSITFAERHYRIAADLGSVSSQFNLANLYINEHNGKSAKREIVKYLLMASGAGYVPAINLLASIYQYGGHGVDQDLSKSISLYKSSIKKGSSDALNSLGIIYSTTMDEPNYALSMALFSEASLLNHPAAKYNLATLYQNGEGTTMDLKKAHKLYLDSALLGYKDAMYNLAVTYKDGIGVEPDLQLCIDWLSKLSTMGDVVAMFNLAEIYEIDASVLDKDLAKYWYKEAASKFCGPAIMALKRINELSSPENLIYVEFN